MTELALPTALLQSLQTYSTVYVGFSGGLDSTVMLHLLVSQFSSTTRLHAIHINHGLSPHANDWQQHVERFCRELSISYSSHAVIVNPGGNLEERARQARYDAFYKQLTPSDVLLLAHHQDDQAETLLMHLMRGAGIDGLAGMKPLSRVAHYDVIRPLLMYSRQQLKAYAERHQLVWIEDESNGDERFSRNFLRRNVMPLLTSHWPSAIKNMARAAAHCQMAQQNLDVLANRDAGPFTSTLPLDRLTSLSRPQLINALRYWIHNQGHQMPSEVNLIRVVNEVIGARKDAQSQVSFGQVTIRRFQNTLHCIRNNAVYLHQHNTIWLNFPSPIVLSEERLLSAAQSDSGFVVPKSSLVEIRYRQGGETFVWHGQTKSLKKCFQQWCIPHWERENVPLIFVDGKLAVVVGFAISDLFYSHQRGYTLCLLNPNDAPED